MLFFSILKRRAKRVIICLKKSLPKALVLQSVMTFIVVVFSFFYLGGEVSYSDLIFAMSLFLVLDWTICFFEQLFRYGKNIFHRYDEDIIGEAFANLSRTAAIFEEGLEYFHKGEFGKALTIFTELDNASVKKTLKERGVLSFIADAATIFSQCIQMPLYVTIRRMNTVFQLTLCLCLRLPAV